jgi:membrane associated rhomboid family serine protease
MWSRLGQSQLVRIWIAILLGASIIAALDRAFAAWASFIPSRILGGEVWRLLTWPFVADGPLSLVVTCVAIYKFGNELVVRWSDRRLQRFMTEVLLGAGGLTTLVVFVLGSPFIVRFGGYVVVDVLVIAWARQFPERPLVLYGLITLSGRRLVQMTVAWNVVLAIYNGPLVMGPELAACAIAALYPRRLLMR